MKKIVVALTLMTSIALLATPAWAACPNGYSACGSKDQLCCPK